MSDTIVWVSGATGGLGLGIARNTPYTGARIINISRRRHPDYESVIADLADPAGWDIVTEHFRAEFAEFRGKRAIFIHNAYYSDSVGLIGKVDSQKYRTGVLANAAAPMILGEAFLTAAAGLDCEVGLVLLSSGATTMPIEGLASYCAAKAGVEYWAEVVHREFAQQPNRWITAIRPGGIDTPGSIKNSQLPTELWPFAEIRKEMQPHFMDIDTAGRRLWSALPPKPDQCLMTLSPAMTMDPANMFGAKITEVP